MPQLPDFKLPIKKITLPKFTLRFLQKEIKDGVCEYCGKDARKRKYYKTFTFWEEEQTFVMTYQEMTLCTFCGHDLCVRTSDSEFLEMKQDGAESK